MIGITLKTVCVLALFLGSICLFLFNTKVDSKIFGYGAPSKGTVFSFFLLAALFIFCYYLEMTGDIILL